MPAKIKQALADFSCIGILCILILYLTCQYSTSLFHDRFCIENIPVSEFMEAQ